jgi:selenocysteine lyase/cysteine desulfurase
MFINEDVSRKSKKYFNNAGMGLISTQTREVMRHATEYIASSGTAGKEVYLQWYLSAKKTLATFVDADPFEVALTPSCSFGLSTVAANMDLDTSDEIVTWDGEYSSNVYPWFELSKRTGAKLTMVKPEKDLSLSAEKFHSAISQRTKIVAFSWVQSATGAITPLQDVARRCREVGAVSVADVAQGVGVLPFNFRESELDVVSGLSHKWLCGPHGLGFLVVRKAFLERLKPLSYGALNFGTSDDSASIDTALVAEARKLETSTPSLILIRGFEQAIHDCTRIGLAQINSRNQSFRWILLNGLRDLGCDVYGDLGICCSGSIISFRHPARQDDIIDRFKENGFEISYRFGRIRLSPHYYNCENEVNDLLQVVRNSIS